MPTSSFTCRAEDLEMLAIPPGGSWPTTPNTGTGNCPGSGSTPTAAGRLPSEGESYAQSAHSELSPHEAGLCVATPAQALAAVQKTVQDAGAEPQAVDRDAFVDAVEHSGKVQIRRQPQRREAEAAQAQTAERLGVR